MSTEGKAPEWGTKAGWEADAVATRARDEKAQTAWVRVGGLGPVPREFVDVFAYQRESFADIEARMRPAADLRRFELRMSLIGSALSGLCAAHRHGNSGWDVQAIVVADGVLHQLVAEAKSVAKGGAP